MNNLPEDSWMITFKNGKVIETFERITAYEALIMGFKAQTACQYLTEFNRGLKCD